MTDSIVFSLIVNVPTFILVVLSIIGEIAGEYGRRAFVVYSALLITLFGTLLGVAVGSSVIVYAAILAGFAAGALSGPAGIAIASAALAAIVVASAAVPLPFSVLGPAIALAGALAVLVQSRVTGRF